MRDAFTRLDLYMQQQMQAANTPGAAIALTDREKLLHIATCGLADVAARRPVAPETLFEIGSITKSFTAIALLQLYEASQVDLHAPVTRYLPWFRVSTRYEPITLHHLLSHTAGIINGTEFSTEARYEVWALRDTEAAAAPGSRFYYSNVGYKALGVILEELLGLSYGEILRERILHPLQMAATHPVITHETRKKVAVGYEPFYDDRPPNRNLPLVPATWFETGTADGSIAATAADMATYLRMLLNGGQGSHGRILSEEGFQLLTRPVIALPEGDEERGGFYGYGLTIGEEDGHTIVGHGGGMVGYYSVLRADLDDGLGVVVLINGPGEPDQVARFALKLLRAAYRGGDLPALPPIPDPTRVENAADYTGIYQGEGRTLAIVAEGEWVVMETGGERVVLERRGEDRFYAPHPELALFLLRFGREKGRVAEVFHGPNRYVAEHCTDLAAAGAPEGWLAYPGHYRSHNPWYTNFRVVLRKGKLLLIEPEGDEEALAPLGGGLFRVGEDEHSPERLCFSTVLDGRALRANLSGCDYFRTFTP
ncbi:MAG: beta-lactamase family protein [Anaerolineae bacterium]|nr:beta-lactamase family protein [Anaerolineae bacterium]